MIPLLSVLLILSLLGVYKHILYPLYLSPLSRIPAAHPTAPISPFWILYVRWRRREVRTVHDAHRRLGPVVRLGPNEVSVNCVKGGVQRVYAGGWEKHEWYSFFANYEVPPMFATTHSKHHSTRKRMLSNIYAKSTIQSSQSLRAATKVIIYERLLPLLSSLTPNSGSVAGTTNMYALFSALTMDFVTAYLFGLSAGTNFVQDTASRDRFLHWYRCRHGYSFWPQELPAFTRFLKKLGLRLVPKFVDAANADIEEFTSRMCQKAHAAVGSQTTAEGQPEKYPAVYAQLEASMVKNQKRATANSTAPLSDEEQQIEIASEVLDHLAAGFDTSGITLTYLAHELSQRPDLQAKLRNELKSLDTPITLDTAPELPSAKDLDALPLLQAVLQETLRLHAAIPGPQPRITPINGGSLGPPEQEYGDLPGGMRVVSQAWSLHRNEEVFPEAEKWRPERWLDRKGDLLAAESEDGGDRYREMMRWFWAFGSGGRMCVGSHLAIYQMKFIIAAIWTNYETAIVKDAGIEQSDAYTAPPSSDELILSLKRL